MAINKNFSVKNGIDVGQNATITGSLTAAGLSYPVSDGDPFAAITTDGNGNLSFANVDTVESDVTNQTGSLIPKGTPVYQTGAAGQTLTIAPSDAANASTMPSIGVAESDIANGDTGRIIHSGFIKGVDTSAFSQGDRIYVADGGGYQVGRPTGETHVVQFLGVVTKVHASNGSGVVFGSGQAYSVPNLDDGNIFIGDNTDTPITATLDTSIVPENGNIYFTDQRAVDAIETHPHLTIDGGTLYIDTDSNRIGINDTSPQEALDVNGNIAVAGDITVMGENLYVGGNSGQAKIHLKADNAGSPALELSDTNNDNYWTVVADDADNNFKIHGSTSSQPSGLIDSPNFEIAQGGTLRTNGNRIFADNYHPNADKWTTARTLSLTGDVTGSVSWDGSGNASITATVADDSHNHTIANVDGLQTALDSKLNSTSYTAADVLTKIKTVDGAGSGLDADLLDGYDSSRFMRRTGKGNAIVGGGWMTVATCGGGRFHGEIIVTDADSGDHAFIRIDWMRSYIDSNFTVLNCGGHTNRIQGARVLYNTSDNTYGTKYLQVYVTAYSSYEVNVYELGDIADYGVPSVVTPVIQNSISGYAVHGNEITGLDTYGHAAEEGIIAGGPIRSNNSMNVSGNTVWHAGNDGAGSGLDADLLDGKQGSYYQPASTAITTSNIGSQNVASADTANGLGDNITTSAGNFKIFTNDGGGNIGLRWNASGSGASLVENGQAYELEIANDSNNGDFVIKRGTTASGTAGDAITWNESLRIEGTTGAIHAAQGFVGDLTGVASTATKLATARTISLAGDVTGSTSWDGSGNASITATVANDSHNHTSLTGVTSISFAAQATDSMSISRTINATGTYFDFNLSDDNNNDWWRWRFNPTGSTVYDAMTLKPVSNGNSNLTVNGTIRATGDVISNSDIRLKSDIKPINNPIETVKALNGKTYIKDDKASIGLIAQEVEEVLPQLVHTASDEMGTKSVAYGNIVAVLIEAVKEQQKQIDELKEKLNGI